MALDIFKLSGSVDVQTGQAEAGLRRVDSASKQTQSALNKAGDSARKASIGFSVFAEKLKGLSATGQSLTFKLSAPLTALGALATQTAVKLDSLKRGLTAVAGSSSAAEAQLARLKKVAELPGLGFEEAIQGSINLQAAGLSAFEAERSLKGFGNALATVGRGKADLEGVTKALTDIQSKGKVQAEEINQLAERVPQIRQVLLDAFGTADLDILGRAGIKPEKFIKVINDALAQLPAVTGGAQNALENFDDTRKRVFGQFGDAILRILVPALEKFTPILERIGNKFASLSPTTQTVIVGIVGVAAAIGPLLVGLGSVAGAVTTIIGLFGSGGLLAVLGPVALVLGALGVAAFGLYKAWQTNFLGIRDITKKAIDGVKGFFEGGWRDALQGAQDMAQEFIATLEGFWNSIPNDLKSALDSLGELLKNALSGLVSIAIDLGSKIGSALVDTLNKKLDGLGDKIIDKLKNIGSTPLPAPGTSSAPKTAFRNDPLAPNQQMAEMIFGKKTKNFSFMDPNAVAKIAFGGPAKALQEIAATSSEPSSDFISSIKGTEGYRRFENAINAAGGDVFLKRVEEIAKRVKANPADLLGVIGFESGFNPKAQNPASKFSGLIQFSPSSARAFAGVTSEDPKKALEQVRAQTALQQLDAVEAYLLQFGKTLDTTEKIYSAVLRGRVLSDPNTVLFKEGSRAFAQNRKLDQRGNDDGRITLSEAAAQITRQGFSREAKSFQLTLKDTVPVVNNIKAAFDPIGVSTIAIGHSIEQFSPKIQTATQATQQFSTAMSDADKEARRAALEANTRADVRRNEVAEQLEKLKQESLGIGENLDLKTELARLQAINDIRQADEDATLSQIANRVKLADKTIFHAERSKAAVLDFLQQETKGFTEIVADAQINTIRSAFDLVDQGIGKLTQKLGAFGDIIKNILSDIAKLALNRVFLKLLGLDGGGAGAGAGAIRGISGGGGGFSLPGLLGIGGGGSPGGIFGSPGGIFGTPPFNPGSQGGIASPLGGILGKIPGLGGLFGKSAAGSAGGLVSGTSAGGLPILNTGAIDAVTKGALKNSAAAQAAGQAGKLGLSFGALGATGLLAGGGILGSLLGGKSPVGQLLGGIGGTLGLGALGATGIFGGGIAGALPALFSNPFTAIIGGALIGGVLLSKLFGDKTLKSLRGLIRGEYAVDVKSNQVLEQVKAIGQQAFGKEFKKKQIETVRLGDVRELIFNYAQSTGQKGNSKLFSAAELQDPYSDMNHFVRRAIGGPVDAFQPAIVGDGGRPEVIVPRVPSYVYPSVPAFQAAMAGQMGRGGGSGYEQMMVGAIDDLIGWLSRLNAIPKGHMIEMGLRENPEAATNAVAQSFRRRSDSSSEIRKNVYNR